MKQNTNYRYPSRKNGFNKITSGVVMEVIYTDPNQDPRTGAPREIDGYGFVSQYSFKRKVRDMVVQSHPMFSKSVEDLGLNVDEYQIIIAPDGNKNQVAKRKAAILTKAEQDKTMPYYDARLFGSLLAVEKSERTDKGVDETYKSRGPLAIGHGKSINQISIHSQQIVRTIGMSEDKTGGMGDVSFVDYGIYFIPIWLNTAKAVLDASRTTVDDIELFRRLIPHMMDGRSAMRGEVNILKFYWYEHDGALADIAEWKLLELFKPKIKAGLTGKSREEYDFFDPKGEQAANILKDNVKHVYDFADF
jgi:Cas7 group CRISPR-associated protein Csh2